MSYSLSYTKSLNASTAVQISLERAHRFARIVSQKRQPEALVTPHSIQSGAGVVQELCLVNLKAPRGTAQHVNVLNTKEVFVGHKA